MLATDQFTMRLSPQDKAMLKRVAMHFQRSQSDTLKTLVREVYEVIKTEKIEDPKLAQEQAATA
jgi:hypothetical protein